MEFRCRGRCQVCEVQQRLGAHVLSLGKQGWALGLRGGGGVTAQGQAGRLGGGPGGGLREDWGLGQGPGVGWKRKGTLVVAGGGRELACNLAVGAQGCLLWS